MSRSERYIAPSAMELERIRRASEAAEQFDRDRRELLRATLEGIKKADLIELLLRITQEEKVSEWLLEHAVDLDKPVDLLAHDIDAAIDVATKVDDLPHCRDYDWRAYEVVQRGLAQLIQQDALEEAKRLSLKLMDKGSHQVECSDEGPMTEEIESCLLPVIAAVAGAPGSRKWALEMLTQDRVGFLCDKQLTELSSQSE
jgi:hypothetical protein